jgi:hypothetical protein
MKILFAALLMAGITQVVKAQTNTITGTVQDEEGRLLHYVYVNDGKYHNAVLSDSTGTFKIAVHPDSKLQLQADGCRDTTISVANVSGDPQVTMKSAIKIPVETIHLTMHIALTEDGSVAPVRRKANVVGSRYLFEEFTRGFFTDMSDKQFYNPRYLFNYEKLSGFLLLTPDKKNVMEILKDQIKSFTLYGPDDQRYDFEMVPSIDKNHYIQVLANGDKYKIYKYIKTSFSASEVAHTAAGDRGSGNDEYTDEPEYYVLDVKTNHMEKLTPKKRSIKALFAKEEDKVNKFMADNSSNVDDTYLSNLGSYMNR